MAFPAPWKPCSYPAACTQHGISTATIQGTAPGITVPICQGDQGNHHLLCLPFLIKNLDLSDPVWLVCSSVLSDGLCSQ